MILIKHFFDIYQICDFNLLFWKLEFTSVCEFGVKKNREDLLSFWEKINTIQIHAVENIVLNKIFSKYVCFWNFITFVFNFANEKFLINDKNSCVSKVD